LTTKKIKKVGSKTKKKQKKVTKKNRAHTIVEIYGHELYRGEDYEACGLEWFHVKYGNGIKQSVTAVVVAKEVPGLGAEYVLEHCMDSEEDRQSFGQWYDRMKYASDEIAKV
jgi:hypothetical protein